MARTGYFKSLKPKADLPTVEVPGLLPDGRVPLEMLNKDLDIFVPAFEGLKIGDTLTLYINSTNSGQTITFTAADEDNPDYKAEFSISTSDYPAAGTYLETSLDYEYVDFATGESSRPGAPLTVTFDREAPGGTSLRALAFTPDQKEGITEADLVAGNLQVSAYAWYGMERGDVITPWVSDSQFPDDIAPFLLPESAVTVQEEGSSVGLKFPRRSFQGVADRYFGYQLRDKLGNVSALSSVTRIPVNLPTTDLY